MRSTIFSTIPDSAWRLSLVVVLALYMGACGGEAEPVAGQSEASVEPDAAPAITYPVTVSGVSAGAYMAVQTHLALSDRIMGVGAVAGGPYHCAAGSVNNALSRCMSGEDLDTTTLVSYTRKKSAAGEIADVGNLRDAKVWIFHSPKDVVVGSKVAAALVEFYENFVSSEKIRFVEDVEAAHGWPTLDAGNDCLVLGGDFLNACGFDTAGELLKYFYDDLAPRDGELNGEVIRTIDLSGFFESGSGVADTGYIFVPGECGENAAECRLHISFHGCRQGAEFLENRFALNAGLNEWAAQNQIVVVYPQIESSPMNPQGCWDWWGYTGPDYDQKSSQQISGIDAIITAFAKQALYQSVVLVP